MKTTHTTQPVRVVLVPGFWLGGWAWDDVATELERTGIVAHAVTLPGLSPTDRDTNTLVLDDHVSAVAALVDDVQGDVVIVGHSGGAPVVQGVVDREPDRFRHVIYVDSGPMLPGIPLGDPNGTGDLEFPGWEPLAAEGNSYQGIDDEHRERIATQARPHPGGVTRSVVALNNDRRLHVPTTVICTSMPSGMLQGLVAAGEIPSELGAMTSVRYVDLPTGHWPMFSRPNDLAELIAQEAGRTMSPEK